MTVVATLKNDHVLLTGGGPSHTQRQLVGFTGGTYEKISGPLNVEPDEGIDMTHDELADAQALSARFSSGAHGYDADQGLTTPLLGGDENDAEIDDDYQPPTPSA